jgi:RNA polymerase sigma factor (sigma-70 family)
MPDAPLTRLSLLNRLRDLQDHEAWCRFVELYAPLLYGYARKRGLQDADAADVTQGTLRQVAAHVGSLEYDPRHGTFRGWLFTIVRNLVRNFQEQPHHLRQGRGDSVVRLILENQPAAPPDETEEWERAYRLNMLARAAEKVRPLVEETSWQAFWQTAVEDKPGREVADKLGLSVSAVYVAKSRVMARLRQFVREVQEDG